MVSFLWGNLTIELPSSADRIKEQMLKFIQEENVEFISYLGLALEDLEQNNKDTQPLLDAFQDIFEDISNDELMPLIRGHDDGEGAIKNFTTSKVRNKVITNQENIDFLEGLKVSDLSDSDALNRLRGFGALKFGQSFENLPEFDIEKYVKDAFTDEDYGVNATLTFDKVPFNPDKDPAMQPTRFSYGKENIVFQSPYDEEDIIESKKNHLIDESGQTPDFRPSKSKSFPPRITKTMRIDIPEKVIKALKDSAKISVIPVKEKTDNNNNVVDFTSTGSEEELDHQEFIELGIAGLADRTELMQEFNVFTLKNKGLVQVVGEKATKGDNRVSLPESNLKAIEEAFLPMLKTIEEKLSPMLSDPMKALTYKGEVNFKTETTVNNSLTRKVEKFLEGDRTWKAGRDEEGNEQFVESIEILVDGKYRQASVEDMMKLEGEAWTNKDTKEKISNSAYMSLQNDEKMAYIPNYYVIGLDSVARTPSNEISTTHKTIREYRLKDAPEDAYAEKAEKIEYYTPKRNADGKSIIETDKNLSPEEAEELKESIEERRQLFLSEVDAKGKKKSEAQIKSDKASAEKLYSFERRYNPELQEGSRFTGQYIDKGEYDRLQAMKGNEDDYLPARKVVISAKRFKSNRESFGAYEPVYDERELDPEDEADAKELRARELRSKREARPPRRGATIDKPDKFGKVTDKALAVVTGAGVQINPLVYYANISDAFDPVIMHIEMVIYNHGEFILSPMQRRRNDEMVNVIEDLKENLSVLKEKIGE